MSLYEPAAENCFSCSTYILDIVQSRYDILFMQKCVLHDLVPSDLKSTANAGSHTTTITLLDRLGTNFDSKVIKWRDTLLSRELLCKMLTCMMSAHKMTLVMNTFMTKTPRRPQSTSYQCLNRAIMFLGVHCK